MSTNNDNFNILKIKKGLNIPLKGEAEKIILKSDLSSAYALKPTDFFGITPKLTVDINSKVKAGSCLFVDKNKPEIKFTSPVSGVVTEINRGEKRKILEIVIEPDKNIEYENFLDNDYHKLSKEEIISILLDSGLWPAIRQRPFNLIANPKDKPKAIFISAFDTAPLAPDYDFILVNFYNEFQTGINILKNISDCKIHLSINGQSSILSFYKKLENVQIHKIFGKHPAGNIGVQIHHIDPINKGEIVWHINPQHVIQIGNLFLKGIYDATKIIALTGSEIIKPVYYKVISGTSIKELVENNVKSEKVRYISGNVLTGEKIYKSGFLGFYDSQITVIPEGDYHEFMGWLKPGFRKYSFHRVFFSWLFPRKKYVIDTNLHGGERPFIMTGIYEKVFPMDILPVQLIKSILAEDIDMMEKLGIYEVAPEDFALCEFICPSKINFQEIVLKGFELLLKELK